MGKKKWAKKRGETGCKNSKCEESNQPAESLLVRQSDSLQPLAGLFLEEHLKAKVLLG